MYNLVNKKLLLLKIISQPPKNKIIEKADINNILQYSPKKNNAKIIEEYSILYPATNSASASGKSKGALFVSANIDIKKIKQIGNNGIKNQQKFIWKFIISDKLELFVKHIIGKIVDPIKTSCEIICAVERNAPRKAYLELLAQPPKIIPYTFKDEIANKKSIPKSILAIVNISLYILILKLFKDKLI